MRMMACLAVLALTSGCGSVSTAQSDSLILILDAPGTASAGAPIRLELTLRNTAKRPAQVMLGGRPPFDFVVTAHDGAEVWRWSRDQIIQAILETRTLQPGEQLKYDAEWTLKDNRGAAAAPGRYLVRGVLNMDPPETMETQAKELVLTSR